MPRRYILEQWEKMVKLTGLQTVPDIQRREMRRAFYGGVEAMRKIMIESPNATDKELEEMELSIQQELTDFSEAIKKGLA